MENILTPAAKSLILIGWLFILMVIEFKIPLIAGNKRKVLPNILLTLLVIVLYAAFGWLILIISEGTAANHFGIFNWYKANVWIVIVAGIMFLDFWAAYVVHVVMHKIEWLWKAHSVHHSETFVDVTTAFRQHPIEGIARNIFLISGMFILGLPAWIVAIYQTLSMTVGQLEHANIAINPKLDKFLLLLFLTPNTHKVHHSISAEETGSNFGNIFSLWDRLFSTLKKRDTYNNMKYGLGYLTNAKDYTFLDLLKLPFKKHKSEDVPQNQSF